MSYLIPYEQYAPLLCSSDEDVIKKALQDIFEMLAVGKRIPKSKNNTFIQTINSNIKSKSQKVRKWAYHCACFYQDELTLSEMIKQLRTEENIENIIWALTALSVKEYNDVDKLRKCVGQRHDEFKEKVSDNYLNDALALFGSVASINPDRIMMANNSADLMMLSKLFAYSKLADNKYPKVTLAVIREQEQNDDPNVREYAYWAQTHTLPSDDYSNMPDDSDDGVRKWQIGLQIQTGDEDSILHILKQLEKNLYMVSLNVRIGILKGLSKKTYCSKYVPYINAWFACENDMAILYPLIDYIIENCSANREDGTFFEIIKDALHDDKIDNRLVQHIISKIENNPQYELIINHLCGRIILDFRSEGENIMRVGNVTLDVSGSGNNVAIGSNNNQIVSLSSQDEKIIQLLQEVLKQSESGLTDADKEKVTESVSCIEAEIRSGKPKKTVIKALLDGLNAIKGTAQFAAAVAALISFFSSL